MADVGVQQTRVTRGGRRWRLVVVLAVAVLLGYGTVAKEDDFFPFGPFVMFAFTTPPSGDVSSATIEAVLPDGRRVPVPLTPGQVGLRRAEVEGQYGHVMHDPRLLGALAVAHHRLHPDAPGYRQVDLVEQTVHLKDGKPVGQSSKVLASWRAS
jgi:hypothetical protein